ncbi:carcinine hydrolase/isopenicillin-N N-acyltransferase family protein [Streptomyces europaeiscabiei]|uniref:carcinine hydrolase/isopenicillin-N N-acyltransferase family protein n=1 Tax=Streptomyces europaeiscabiei TaxID=146819 RepID=UPI0038F73888
MCILGGDWRPGVPPYLAIRHVLDTAGTVEQAVGILRELPLASSRAFMICGVDRTVCVEATVARRRVLEGDEWCTRTTSWTPSSPSRTRSTSSPRTPPSGASGRSLTRAS